MVESISVHDKQFVLSIDEVQIATRVRQVAQLLQDEVAGQRPLFICVLNGAFMFAADILKYMNEPCEVSFVKYSSYQGTSSSGEIKQLIGLNENIKGRIVVVIEDIVDSGYTMSGMVDILNKAGAERVIIASLLMKPGALKVNLHVDLVGFEIPNDFVVGYGLDYNGLGRNLPGIYKVV